jgi:hypothetical protein
MFKQGDRPKGRMPKEVEHSAERIELLVESGGPVWHNLVGMRLSAVAKDHGKEWANWLIVDCGLDGIGWSVHE